MREKTLIYLGRHTSIGYLSPLEWKKIPYLKDNDGCLPPLIIAVGDSRRVTKAHSALQLKNILVLHEESERLLGLTGKGRVDLIIGEFTHKKRSVPLLLVETQMGMPATDIILREVLSHCHVQYNFGRSKIKTDAINIVRVGTAGGINSRRKGSKKLSIGDIVNAEFSLGWAGAILQSMAGLDYSSKNIYRIFKKKWLESGNSFTKDGRFPLMENSKELVDSISSALKELGCPSHRGGNFSKDSLYAEIDTDSFLELRDKYNVLSTEMEQMVLGKLAGDFRKAGLKLNTGLVSGIIGVLPDESFSDKDEHRALIEKVEENSLMAAAIALWRIAK